MHPTRALSSISLLFLMACGGSSTAPGSGSNSCTAAPLSATINGVAWCSPLPQGIHQGSLVSIAGFDTGITTSISFVLSAAAPGTYSIGFGNNIGGFGDYVKTSQGWSSGLAGGTGSVTITTLSATHVVGTFVFDAVPSTGGATGTIHVTNGQFNITF